MTFPTSLFHRMWMWLSNLTMTLVLEWHITVEFECDISYALNKLNLAKVKVTL